MTDEDITPVDTLPTEQFPETKPPVGWQEPPLPTGKVTPTECNHMGKSLANMGVARYAMGAQWVCICGQIFVVALTDGGKKTLRKAEDVVPVETEPGVETPEVPDEPLEPTPDE